MKNFNIREFITNNPLLKEEENPEYLQAVVDYFVVDINRGKELLEFQKAFILTERYEILKGNYTPELAAKKYLHLVKQLQSDNPEVQKEVMDRYTSYVFEPEMTQNIWNNLKNTYGIENLGDPPISPTKRGDLGSFAEFLLNRAGEGLESVKDYFKKVYDYFVNKKSYMRKQAEINKDSIYPDYADSAEAIADAVAVSGQLAIYLLPVIGVIAGFLYKIFKPKNSSGKKWYPSQAKKDYEDTDTDGFSQGQIFERKGGNSEMKDFMKNTFTPFVKAFDGYLQKLSTKKRLKLLFSIAKATKSNDESKLNAVLPNEVMPEYNKVVDYLKGEETKNKDEKLNEISLTDVILLGNLINGIINTYDKLKNGTTVAERYITEPKLAYADAFKAKGDRQLKKVKTNVEKALKSLRSILEQTKVVIQADTEYVEDAVVKVGKELGRNISIESLEKQIDETLNNAVLLSKLHSKLNKQLNTVDADAKVVDEIFNVRNWQCRRCGSPFTYTLLGKRYCEPDDDFNLDCPNSYTGTPRSRQEDEYISLNESIHEGELEDKQQDTLSTIEKLLKQIEKLTNMYKDTENNE